MPGANASINLNLTIPLCRAGDLELILGVRNPLLELPAIGVRLAALHLLQLCACLFELAFCPFAVDLLGGDGVVHERDCPVLLHLEEADRKSTRLNSSHRTIS